MDLGRISIRGQGINVLHQALHPKHGLVWTDGKSINLAPVQILQGEVENQKSLKLGEFEHSVTSVHWSSNIGPQTCYMCVVHPQHVSVWKVDGAVPKLSFKQVRKLNVQPIHQGCLWNPGRDILCVLSKQQCSFFFRHTQNKGSYAFPQLESGKISCGTWSGDGSRLVLCVGAVLLIYTWSEIDMSISDFTPAAWRIPELDGSVTSVTYLSNNVIACAAELPLEFLCKTPDTFVIPDLDNGHANSVPNDHDPPMIVQRKVKPSIKDSLLNLQRNPESMVQDASQLITIQLLENKDPRKRCCVRVKGILSPEILLYEPTLSSIIVGSNTQNYLQVFTFEEGNLSKNLIKTVEIHLEKLERPKGIGSLPQTVSSCNKGVLICVGIKSHSDPAFLPSSTGTSSDLTLKFYPVHIDFSVLQSRLNGSYESLDSAISSQSSIGSPRRIKIQYQSDMESAQSSPRDLDTSTETDHSDSTDKNVIETDKLEKQSGKDAAKDSNTGWGDIYLPKQNTITELRDTSDVDSEICKKDSASESDPDVSPRDITMQTVKEQKGKVEIIDLNKSGGNESDLETETVDFSEQKANFKVQNNSECFQDVLNEEAINKVQNRDSNGKEDIVSDTSGDSSQGEQNGASKCPTEEVSKHEVKVLEYSKEPVVQDSTLLATTQKEAIHDNGLTSTTQGQVSSDLVKTEEAESEADLVTVMEQHIQEQEKQIELLRKKVGRLSQQVDGTSIVFPSRYQTLTDPETVLVVCRHPNAKTHRKTFLLDDGRLCLEAVKRTFRLDTVELFIDGDPCVLGSNIDGYIPMRFNPASTLIITGLPAEDKRSHDRNKHGGDSDSDEPGIEAYDSNDKDGTVC